MLATKKQLEEVKQDCETRRNWVIYENKCFDKRIYDMDAVIQAIMRYLNVQIVHPTTNKLEVQFIEKETKKRGNK